jgi:adenylate kinase family enzyme
MSKLIILRGPSGAGKSTVAKQLHRAGHKSLLIEQDYYKEFMVWPKTEPYDVRKVLIRQNVLTGLEHDYDVIMDGIFSVPSWNGVLEDIFQAHPANNYAFYFDVSLDETIKRHATRPQSKLFGEAELREWFPGASGQLLKDFEHVIPESNTVEHTVDFIRHTTGLL